jgi:hypothetical protein
VPDQFRRCRAGGQEEELHPLHGLRHPADIGGEQVEAFRSRLANARTLWQADQGSGHARVELPLALKRKYLRGGRPGRGFGCFHRPRIPPIRARAWRAVIAALTRRFNEPSSAPALMRQEGARRVKHQGSSGPRRSLRAHLPFAARPARGRLHGRLVSAQVPRPCRCLCSSPCEGGHSGAWSHPDARLRCLPRRHLQRCRLPLPCPPPRSPLKPHRRQHCPLRPLTCAGTPPLQQSPRPRHRRHL